MDKKKVAVYSAKKAVTDYNKKLIQFNEVLGRMRTPEERMMMQQNQEAPQMTLDTYLMSTGMPASFAAKAGVAKQLGMPNYTGGPEQDNSLLMALQGKTMNDQTKEAADKEHSYKTQEMGLKEQELGLKQKEIESNRQPSSEEIAQSLMSKIQ